MRLTFVETFETCQCIVSIYKSDSNFNGEDVYVMQSVHKDGKKILTRFGTKAQIECIKNTYRIVK